MRSIRFFLVAGILAVIILSSFIASLRGYQASMAQAESLFDNELLDLAYLVENLDISRLDKGFRLGNNMAFQIWQENRLLAASSHAPAEPITTMKPGFDEVNFDGYRWRTYARFSEDGRRWVVVAERKDLRFVLAENVVLESIVPILLGIPLIGLLVWGVITVGLQPLAKLSADLKKRAANDMTPLAADNNRRELDQVVQSINGYLEKLGAAFEREQRFSADAAHELRTPISALKVQLYNLKAEVAQDSDAIDELQDGIDRMQHLVEQLLSLYRMCPEQFAVNTQAVDLYTLAEGVIAKHYHEFEYKKQQVELFGDHLSVRGDPFAIETLLSNLLANACKYTQSGGEVKVNVIARGKKVVLRVEDNGPGIKAENRERIFERFYREPAQQAAGKSGCGLGLAIVEHVAALHEASPQVVGSSFGKGCGIEVIFNAESSAA